MAKLEDPARGLTEGEWLTQMHVFPERGDGSGEYEHDYPYTVEYNPDTGERRTRRLNKDEVEQVRAFNQLPPEDVVVAYDRNDPPPSVEDVDAEADDES